MEADARPKTDKLAPYRSHVLARIEATPTGSVPFNHLFIDNIFPAELYQGLLGRMLDYKGGGSLQRRRQDSAEYVNSRYRVIDSKDAEISWVRSIFSNPEVKLALLRKFYVDPTRELARSLEIHKEFEFVYTAAGRFQNIHVDIPPKFMSFVFYLPEHEVSEREQELNATVLYDRNLEPQHRARYQANSVCVFVPHFHSYHGFSTTVDRTALVMFYINRRELDAWSAIRVKDAPPFAGLKDAIQSKLTRYPLLEYGSDPERIAREREACLVNAPQGRVMRAGEKEEA
jgi:hypothetical protein